MTFFCSVSFLNLQFCTKNLSSPWHDKFSASSNFSVNTKSKILHESTKSQPFRTYLMFNIQLWGLDGASQCSVTKYKQSNYQDVLSCITCRGWLEHKMKLHGRDVIYILTLSCHIWLKHIVEGNKLHLSSQLVYLKWKMKKWNKVDHWILLIDNTRKEEYNKTEEDIIFVITLPFNPQINNN